MTKSAWEKDDFEWWIKQQWESKWKTVGFEIELQDSSLVMTANDWWGFFKLHETIARSWQCPKTIASSILKVS
ncbi:hypothetical protein N7449_005595 [Penicillium cf. viridicatum]|uniref:Uncharacterized protein n=1 Tax=Penicillium cf. viridicatum TaxID=2972119 RepID=A0A9W9MLG1_9EURO|nr:hypothetical protein N7449_005595 [Penicillium cf. viridicatum]